jgi:hypothetical protein
MTARQLAALLLVIGLGMFALMEYVIGYNTAGSLIVITCLPASIGIFLAKWLG